MSDPRFDLVLQGDLEDWIGSLPEYQHAHILRMLQMTDPVGAATAWLEASGPRDNAPYGGVRAGAANFYSNLLLELQKLLCGNEGYEDERKQLAALSNGTKLMIVGTVSTALAPAVGAAAAVIGPAVAITLALLSNAGQASVCDVLAGLIADRSGQGPREESEGA